MVDILKHGKYDQPPGDGESLEEGRAFWPCLLPLYALKFQPVLFLLFPLFAFIFGITIGIAVIIDITFLNDGYHIRADN